MIFSGSVNRANTAAGGAGMYASRRTTRASCIGLSTVAMPAPLWPWLAAGRKPMRQLPRGRCRGLLGHHLAHPFFHDVCDLVRVFLQHHHVAIAVDPHGAEIEPGRAEARLLHVLDEAMRVGRIK